MFHIFHKFTKWAKVGFAFQERQCTICSKVEREAIPNADPCSIRHNWSQWGAPGEVVVTMGPSEGLTRIAQARKCLACNITETKMVKVNHFYED